MSWEVQEEDSFGLLAHESLCYTFVEGDTSEIVAVAGVLTPSLNFKSKQSESVGVRGVRGGWFAF